MKALLQRIRQILKDRRTRRFFKRFVGTFAAIVVFITTYALVLPAITMESEASCGIEAHQHSDDCYEEMLVCEIPESSGHLHDETCYDVSMQLACQFDEHQHGEGCYDENGELTCEKKEHTHSEENGCYQEVKELVCGLEESAGHQHDSNCYEKELTCGKEVHTHSAACYRSDDPGNTAEGAAVSSTNSAGVFVNSSSFASTDIVSKEEASSAGSATATGNEITDILNEDDLNEDDLIEDGLNDDGLNDEELNAEEPGADNSNAEASGGTTISGEFASSGTDAAATSSAVSGISANDETAASSNTPAASSASTASTTTDPSAAPTSTASTAADASSASASAASTGASTAASAASTAAGASAKDTYVPALNPLDFNQILTDRTGIYYFHPEDQETAPENSGDITDWKPVEKETILDPDDILRVYLAYSIPAGSLNETNPVARYCLPSNLHLSDSQMKSINSAVNGIANQYVSMDTLEITDPVKYSQSLGVEAIEGTRRPSDNIDEFFAKHTEMDGQEYISATVKVKDVYDTDDTDNTDDTDVAEGGIVGNSVKIDGNGERTDVNGENSTYLGTDLVFTFTPYSVQKNQYTYDSTGKPTSAGQKIQGWLTFDLRTDQIDFETVGSVDVEKTEDGETADDSETGVDKETAVDEGTTGDKEETADTEISVDKETVVDEETIVDNEPSDGLETIADNETINDIGATADEEIIEDTETNVDMGIKEESDSEPDQDDPTESDLTEKTDEKSAANTVVEKEATIVFVPETKDPQSGLDIDEISQTLHLQEIVIEAGAATDDKEEESDKTEDESAKDETAENGSLSYPALTFQDSITTSMGTLSTDTEAGDAVELPEQTELTVYVEADEGTFPEGTTMKLSTVEDMDTVASAVEEAVTADDAVSNKTHGFHALDISFRNVEGKEIEPRKPIRVSIKSESIKQAVEDASTAPVVVHITDPATDLSSVDDSNVDDSNADGLDEAKSDKDEPDKDEPAEDGTDDSGKVNKESDQGTVENAETEEPETENVDYESPVATIVETEKQTSTDNGEKDDSDTLTFEAGTFSVYAIVYTVDFHYEVNGKMYEFSIPGGGFVSLEHLAEVLGIAEGDKNENATATTGNTHNEAIKLNEVEVSEATKKFVENVEKVEFSSPELVWVGKVEEETNVRKLKESNKLEVKYSGDLKVKDIAKINAQLVAAGDWALISVRPFEDEQSLTITMKDGEVFTIQVAGQAHSDDVRVQYSSEDGDIIVTACAQVGTLPENTKIKIREIDPYADVSEEIEEEAKLYAKAVGAVANKLWQEHLTLGGAKVMDISFIDTDGNEIEPEGDVDVSLMFAETLKTAKGETIGLAHILDEEEAETEFLKAEIDDKETVFTSNMFSIYVVFNGNTPATGENAPVNFDKGWIRFGGNMQARTDLPNGYFNAWEGTWASEEGSWKWLTVELYELKQGVSESGYNNHDNYNLLSTYSYLAGNTDIIVEDYDFNGRDVLCTTFTDRYYGDGTENWQFFDAKNGVETKRNYGGIALGHDVTYYGPGVGQWDVDDPSVLRIYLSREKEVVREPRTEYVIRYYHADGTFDSLTGKLLPGQTLSINANDSDKIRSNEEVYSGLTIAAGHGAFSNINTSNGTASFGYNSTVPLVKANVYYKEKIEIKEGGTVTGQPLYDTKIEDGKKIYDTSTEGLHTDKTATPVMNSANASYNDGRTFNLTLESWNVGPSGADVGMVLDASGSMTWSSSVPEPVKVTNMPSGAQAGNLSNWLTLEQVNSILDKTRTDSSAMGYNGYTYYIQDSANGNEFVPLGYYDKDTQANSNKINNLYATTTGITFSKNSNAPDSGWYYVNTSNAKNYKGVVNSSVGSGKQYANWGSKTESGELRNENHGKTGITVANDGMNTATSFYIKDGELWAVWTRSADNNTPRVYQSRVYIKPNDGVVKDEVLQNAISRFTAILNAQSPQSQIAMTRFSRNSNDSSAGFTDAELALLNWSKDSITIIAAMNQLYGNPASTKSNVTQYDSGNGNGLEVYNYAFTGETSTKRGLDAFVNDLTNNYIPKATNTNNGKYLILFTDGKDTDTSDWTFDATNKTVTSNNNNSAIKKAENLKYNDYTIFTVLMRSGSMSTTPGGDVDKATAFLKELSGTKNSTASEKDNYFFDIAFDNPSALVDAFERIAKEIAKPLDGYMVRDYIDPRFDLIDANGNIRTRLNRYGMFTPAVITLSDGKNAMLKYDSGKEMFYIEVQNQSIPTTPQYEKNVTVNSIELTVRAKDDFIGGNDILSNGNEDGQNQVFKPVDDYVIGADMPTAWNTDTSTYPKKDYPKTTTNPATYGTTLLDYEDTIFLNETISPIDLFGQVSTMDDETANDNHLSVYVGYLSRAGKKLHDDENYYINILQNGVLPGDHQNENGEVITITDTTVTINLPYYYLKDENNVRSYAGGDLHQGDKVGTITYTWKAIDTGGHTLTDNNAFKDYMSTTLDTVKYQLSMSYTPDPVVSNDNIANNGSARTLTLTNQTGNDKLIRDPVGNAAESQSTDTTGEGLAVVHVVAGKIGITKKIAKQDLDDKGIGKSNLPSVAFAITKDGTAYKTVTADMSQSTLKNGYYEITVWETDLPKGTYSVSEVNGDGYKLDSFDALTIQDDSSTATVNESQFAAKYAVDSDAKAVTWYIGPKGEAADRQPDVSTYPECVNGTVLFPYNLVADSVYHVDPNLAADNEKYYLNGQIGQAVYINKLNPLVMLRKADMTNSSRPVNGAEFSFYKEVETETAGALTDVIAGKSVMAVSEVISGDYVQVQGADQGEKLAGYVSLGDLDTDGTYYLVEDSVPDGYMLPEWKYVKITLTDTQINWASYKEDGSICGSPQSVAKETVDGKKCYTVTILNNPGVELPATGGPGTRLFTILGSVFVMFSGAMLWRRRRYC